MNDKEFYEQMGFSVEHARIMKQYQLKQMQAAQAQQAAYTQYISVSRVMMLLPNLSVEQLQDIYDVLKPLLKERYIECLAKLEEVE